MRKEFMLYIRNSGDAKAALSPDEHLAFIRKCEVYIGKLKSEGSLLGAQPLVREGSIISRQNGGWISKPIDLQKEVQVGYYHILADDLNEAIEMAKENPEFEYVASAAIEVRPIKMKEEQTDFTYPNK
jgi:hypothetical protein